MILIHQILKHLKQKIWKKYNYKYTQYFSGVVKYWTNIAAVLLNKEENMQKNVELYLTFSWTNTAELLPNRNVNIENISYTFLTFLPRCSILYKYCCSTATMDSTNI